MTRMTAGWLIGPRLGIPGRVRLAFAGVALVCLAILTVARMLPPNQRGMGTHEALGLPPCGFVLTSGLPCPTCGMTTAFALLLHGRPVDAFVAQPAGAVLCVATLALFILSVQTVWTGRMIQVNWDRIGHVRLLVGFGLLVLGGWGFKLAHGLLTGAFPAH